jgi:integrase
MATIYLTQSPKTDANGESELLIRFSHGKINQRAKTNIFLSAMYWNAEGESISIPKARVLSTDKKKLIDDLNAKSERLATITATVTKSFNDADKNTIAPDWLKLTIDKLNFPEKYEAKDAEPEIKTLFQYIDGFVNDLPRRKTKDGGRPLTQNATKQYNATVNYLKDFAKSVGKKDFDFVELDKELNQSFYDGFVSYLQKKDFTQNSVGKHIKVLKVILNDAKIHGFNVGEFYNSFHVFKEDADNIYLDEKELQLLKDKDLSKTPHLDRVRDWFLLLAWTGCRFSDLEKIGKTDIKDGFITFRQQKTNNKVTIPLHPVVLEILEKYGYQMPEPITNQRFNEYIKEACKLAEIKSTETMTRTVGGKLVTEKFEKWEHVSSHTGRRSFCTNMYKRGLPTLMIMSISGHTTEKSFLKYIKVKQEEHAAMMAKEWAKMYNTTK